MDQLPHRISVEYYYSDMICRIATADRQQVKFTLSPELRKLFESEMNNAISKNT